MRLFTDASASIRDTHLRRAFKLAERGRGATAPNPLVGCVVVRDGVVVGEGFHERAGGPHAEIVALHAAGEAARGATVYVTLEPCAHWGATPPCTDALIAAGVAEVVVGMADPTLLAGGGAALLGEAGIEVSFAKDAAPFAEQNEAWLVRSSTGLPWVQVKVAASLDGKLSLRDGVRSAISGPGGGSVTMRLRAAADGVCVGARTAVIDAPALTVRDSDGADSPHQPLRVILARDEIPVGLSMFADGRGPVAVACHEGADADALPSEIHIVRYDPAQGLRAALAAIAEAGVNRLLIEAGPRLLTALWDRDLIDELVVVHAGGMAGAGGASMYLGAVADGVSDLTRSLHVVEAAVVGGDAVTVWKSGGRPAAAVRQEGR